MDPVVSLPAGRVGGTAHGDVAAFLGIPYAAPPFGAHRFGPPAPAAPWDGVRPARDYGPTAPQPHRQMTLIPEPVIPGEDCLNLNVFTPDPGGGGLPVLVWIHGGGFTAGCNNSPWYWGGSFARHGVILVSINYRLGAEGFLPIDGTPANRAVLDWLAALRWVQGNIEAFGGDPGRVTIAGQSAGGVACANLVASPAARGLFRSAICMSGSRLPTWDVEEGRKLTEVMAEVLAVAPTREALAAVPPARLVAAQDEVQAILGRRRADVRLPFGPMVDGEIVGGAAALAPSAHDAPGLVLGATAEEFNASLAAVPGGIDEDRMTRRMGRLGLDPAGIAAYRRALPDAAPGWVLGQAMTDAWFKAPALRLADTWAGGGGRAWLYAFDWSSASPAGYGSVHCLDVPFAFDNLAASGVEDVTGPRPPQALADAVHGALVAFVAGDGPGWDPYRSGQGGAMVFDEVCRLVDEPWPLVRDTWLSRVKTG